MKQIVVDRAEMRFVGMGVRTNNKQEAGKVDGKIFPLVQKYFHGALAEKIAHRKNPGTTLCVYTDYESDEHGDYTYYIGEEVIHFDQHLPAGFETLIIPAQTYVKFTTDPAPMPDVLLGVWQKVWGSTPKDLGGKRTYAVDFELYDERASDHSKIVLDLFIAITPTLQTSTL
jgi:predicted transcriptional regulator YdeE